MPTSGDYTYTLDGDDATITAYSGTGGAVAIPATLDGHPVVAIGDNLFSLDTTVTSLIVPDSITNIGINVCYDANLLSSIVFGSGVTTIGNSSFLSCPTLVSATFSGNAPTIGSLVFSSAHSGFTIYYQSGATGWTNPWYGYTTVLDDGSHVSGDYTYTLDGDSATITDYSGAGGYVTIPSTLDGHPVVALGSDSFANNASITSVIIPDSVASIGNSAFSYCTNLVSVIFMGNAPTLGNSVFNWPSGDVAIYYQSGATGWTTPWYGYTTHELVTGRITSPLILRYIAEYSALVDDTTEVPLADIYEKALIAGLRWKAEEDMNDDSANTSYWFNRWKYELSLLQNDQENVIQGRQYGASVSDVQRQLTTPRTRYK